MVERWKVGVGKGDEWCLEGVWLVLEGGMVGVKKGRWSVLEEA